MGSCIFIGGIMWIAMGDVMIQTDQIVKQPGQQVVELVTLSGQTYQFDVPRNQWVWDSGEWYSNCLADAVAYDGPRPFRYE